MATLKEIRQAFPEYAKVPDDVLSEALYKKYGEGVEKPDFLLELQGRGPRIGPIEAGYEGMKSSAQTGIARLLYGIGAEETGREMQQRAAERSEDVAARYQPEIKSYEDVTGPVSAGQYLYEGAAQSAPYLGATAAGALAGAGIGSIVPVIGTGAGALLGAAAAQFPMFLGSNIERQMDEGKKFEETELAPAAGAAALQTAASTASFRVGAAGLLPGIAARGGTARLRNFAVRGLETGASEAVSESAQGALEIMQANPDKFFEFGPDVQKEIINQAILGGGLGFLTGGAGGALSTRTARAPEAETPAEKVAATTEGAAAEGETAEGTVAGAAKTPVEGEGVVAGAPIEGAAVETPAAETQAVETPISEGAVAPAPRIAAEPAVVETVATEPVSVEPATVETAAVEPAVVEPAAVEPAAIEPVAKTPAIKPETISLFTTPEPPALPKILKAGQPVIGGYQISFPSDVERALFQISKPNPTKRDREYGQWLKDQGLSDQDIKDFGTEFRATLEQQAKAGPGEGELSIPRFQPLAVQQALARPTAEPIAVPPAQAAPAAEPIAAEPAAPPVEQAPPTTVQEPAPPPPQTEPFVREPSTFTIAPKFEKELEGYIPGISGVMREIQQNLFPGTELRVTRSPERAKARGKISIQLDGANNMVMRLNVDALKSEFGGRPEAFKAKLLHTIFHEMAHPVEYFYVANADPETISAILRQYVKDRNPSSMQRAFIVKGLIETRKGGDLGPILDGMLKDTGLTRKQYENFLASESKATGDALVSRQAFGSRYQRSFSEWVAEKGAEFYTKNLEQLVPKNVFEKFQKDILELLRDLYSRIAKFLGMPETEGAFERLMKDKYGKVKKTPTATVAALQRLEAQPEYIKEKGKALDTGARTAVQAEEAAAPADITAATQKLAKVYTKPEAMGFKGFLRAIKEAYDSGSYKNLGDKLSYAITDRFIYVKRLQERYVDWLKKQGLNLEAAYDDRHALAANLSPYAAILGRENVLGQLETLIKYGGKPVIKMFSKSNDPLEKSLDGMLLIDDTDKSKGLTFLSDLIQANKLDDFKYYAMAKRVLGKYADKEAPISQAEAKSIVDHYGKDPVVMKAYDDYQNFNKALMQMAVDAGVISQDVANEFMKHNDYYPFYREMDETGRYTGPLFSGGVLTRTKIQKAVGGTGQLEADPVEVIMKNAQFWMHSAAKNVAARKIFTMMEGLDQASKIKKGTNLPPDQAEGVVRVNGVEQYYALKDPVMAAALETTGAQQLPNWTQIPGGFTRFYRELVTRSPDFILKNVFRDPTVAFVTSGVSFNPFAAIRNFGTAVVRPQSSENIRAIQNWGIKGGFRSIPGVDDATQLLNENFKPTSNGIYVVPNGRVLTGILSKAWNKLGEISEASDAATRMEIYKQVLAKTGNEAEAAFRAQEVINFRKQGASSLVRYLSVMVPFINGRLQGMDVTARAFGPKAFANTMIKGGYLFAVAMALQALTGDDEEYKQLPDYIRYGSLPVPLKLLGLGDSGFVAIPKPFEIGFVFQTFPELLVQAAMGNIENRDIPKAAWEQLKSTFGLAMFPQIVAPIAELLINRSTLTGLPIVTEAQKNLPPELQYTAATSDIVKNLAGAAGLSPVQVEALIKGYGGQITTSMLGLIDGMYRSASGTGVDKDWTQYPTISTFLKTQANTNPKGVSDVYRLSAEIQGLTTAINTYVAQGQAEKARNLMKENEGLLTIKQSVSGLRTQLNTLSRNERMLVNNPNIPQDQKNAQLEQIKEARRQIGKVMTENLIEKTGK